MIVDKGPNETDAYVDPRVQDELYTQTFADLYPTFEHIQVTTLNARTCMPILPKDLLDSAGGVADYTLFLGKPAEELTKNVNRRYTDLMMTSLSLNTFVITDFLHLGNFRVTIGDTLTECQSGIARQILESRRGGEK